MALVNALQHNASDPFHQRAGDPAGRLMKIRSIWPFPVRGSIKGNHPGELADLDPPQEEAGDSVAPSSFVT
jgi:hypothetical protein